MKRDRERSRSRSPRRPRNVQSRRCIISNIPYDLKWQEIKDLFRTEGKYTFIWLSLQLANICWACHTLPEKSDFFQNNLIIFSTGYNQSVTGCGSQRRHVVVTQRKLMETFILSSNWIWLRWETNTLKCVWCSTKTTFNVYVSQRRMKIMQFSLSYNYIVFVENHSLWRFDCTQCFLFCYNI